MHTVWKIIKGIFWAAIILASIFIIMTSLNLFGFQAFIVKSGSMEPEVKTGSMVFDKKTDDYAIGEIITYKVEDNSTVTHRLYSIESENNQTYFVTKGDANNSPDPNKVSPQNVVGEVLFSVPLLGYFVSFLRTPVGLIVFIIIPATIIVYEELGNIKKEIAKMRKKSKKPEPEAEKVEEEKVVKKIRLQ